MPLPTDKAKRLATLAAFLGCALVLSYAESLLPPLLPGAKLGLANIAVLFVLKRYGIRRAYLISCLRIVMCAVLFGNITGFVMSFCGGIAAVTVMWLLMRVKGVSTTGISVGGAAAHNIAQVSAAALLAGNAGVFIYLTPLLLLAIPTGIAVGAASACILRVFDKKSGIAQK